MLRRAADGAGLTLAQLVSELGGMPGEPLGHEIVHESRGCDGLAARGAFIAGPAVAGHRRGGAEHQEDECGIPEGQDAAGEGGAGQLRAPDVAEDGCVAQVVQRVRGERERRGYGDGTDLAVDLSTSAARHRRSVPAAARGELR